MLPITFRRQVKICLQNNNGPCPLLAIANVLSLRNELKLPAGVRDITQARRASQHSSSCSMRNSMAIPEQQLLAAGNHEHVCVSSVRGTPELAVFTVQQQ
eukprot:GHRQ01031421.1.p1 GENE.GHRQ01031421.1~~GHRQ01031421.1.p1  ORF type:complete len:100 (-),score=25.51 GHRQ01031421.1:709-1008(-)